MLKSGVGKYPIHSRTKDWYTADAVATPDVHYEDVNEQSCLSNDECTTLRNSIINTEGGYETEIDLGE